MKKTAVLAVCALILALAMCTLVACNGNESPVSLEKYEVSYEALQAESYKDYASEVRLNTELYQELDRQGLRLITGYSGSYAVGLEGRADDEETIRNFFDPNKGILVIINGLQYGDGTTKGGRAQNANMQSDSRILELADFGNENEIQYFSSDPGNAQIYDLGKYWRDDNNGYKGYNVFYFHWEMFADYVKDGGLTDAANAPFAVQERVWSLDSGVQAAYVRDGKAQMTEPGKAVNGSVAEWFAAEYLRMANTVSSVFENYGAQTHDIRIAGHSMGGLLTVAGSTLLHLLAEAGQLQAGFAPNRLALMDSFLGISAKKDFKIAWSGKDYIHPANDEECCNYIAALDMLVNKFGTAVEFVCNEGYVVPFLNVGPDLTYNESVRGFEGLNAKYANAIIELCPIIYVRPYFAAVGGGVMFNGHNPVREWYLSTILYDAPKVGDVTVPTARMSDSDVRAARGNYFVMVNERTSGCETVRCDDDQFALNRTEKV